MSGLLTVVDMVISGCDVAMVIVDGSLCIAMEMVGDMVLVMVTVVGTSSFGVSLSIVWCLFKAFSIGAGITEIGSFPSESKIKKSIVNDM